MIAIEAAHPTPRRSGPDRSMCAPNGSWHSLLREPLPFPIVFTRLASVPASTDRARVEYVRAIYARGSTKNAIDAYWQPAAASVSTWKSSW